MIGERLGEVRKDHSMTQKQLAEVMKVSEATVSAWERNITCPDDETKVRLARMFNISTDYLLGVTDVPTPIRPSAQGSSVIFLENVPGKANQEIREFLAYLKNKYQTARE